MANQDDSARVPPSAQQAEDNPALRTINNLGDLPAWRQLALIIGLAACIAIAISFVMWLNRPAMSVLYSNLNDRDLGQLVQVLQRMDVAYSTEGHSLLVPASSVHDLRLRLAADGLPADSLAALPGSGGGDILQSARARRSLELELSRSVMSLSNVQGARVHLGLPVAASVDAGARPSASVLLNLFPGHALESGQIAAISHLVSSAVPQLAANQVSIVDQYGKLLSGANSDAAVFATRGQLEYLRELEQHYVERINAILEPVVGRDAFRARVSAEVDFSSTLPAGDRGSNGDIPQVSGKLQRLSVAVVVDDKTVTLIGGREQTGRRAWSPEELNQMQALVKEATGYRADRGDSVSLINAAFNRKPPQKVEIPQASFWETPGLADQLWKLAGLLVMIVLMWKVFRPALQALAMPRPAPQPGIAHRRSALSAATDEAIRINGQGHSAEQLLAAAGGEIDILKEVARNEPGMVAQVIKSWVAEGR